MQSSIDKPKLVQVVVGAYDIGELAGFLSDYFKIRLDHIITQSEWGLLLSVARSSTILIATERL